MMMNSLVSPRRQTTKGAQTVTKATMAAIAWASPRTDNDWVPVGLSKEEGSLNQERQGRWIKRPSQEGDHQRQEPRPSQKHIDDDDGRLGFPEEADENRYPDQTKEDECEHTALKINLCLNVTFDIRRVITRIVLHL